MTEASSGAPTDSGDVVSATPSPAPDSSDERRARSRATSRMTALRFQQDGDHEAVRAGFTAAARIDPTDPQPRYNLAVLAEQLSRTDEAILHYEACVKLAPGTELQKLSIASLERLRGAGAPAERRSEGPAPATSAEGIPPLALNTPRSMPRPRTPEAAGDTSSVITRATARFGPTDPNVTQVSPLQSPVARPTTPLPRPADPNLTIPAPLQSPVARPTTPVPISSGPEVTIAAPLQSAVPPMTPAVGSPDATITAPLEPNVVPPSTAVAASATPDVGEHPATPLPLPTDGGPGSPSPQSADPSAGNQTITSPLTSGQAVSTDDRNLTASAPLVTPSASRSGVGAATAVAQPTSDVDLRGTMLGDFYLEKRLGRGGMGEVYLARQVSLDRVVAVKILARHLAQQPGFRERFEREAKSAATINHPNVLQVYAYGCDANAAFFAMEYVEGEDLQQRMARVGRLPLEEVVSFASGIARALGAAHEKNVVHRDVKPSNVMIDPSGNVKVMDFGLAKAAGGDQNLTQSGMVLGTPNYLSPEQGRGEQVDNRSDLYSLGVILYQMLAGTLPFTATSTTGVIFKHVYEDVPPLAKVAPDVPKFLADITTTLLQKNPANRYVDAKAIVADLVDFLEHKEHYLAGGERRTGSWPKAVPPAPKPPERAGRSHGALVSAIVLFVAIAVAGAAYVALNPGQALLKLGKDAIGFSRLTARLESLDGKTRMDLRAEEGVTIAPGDYNLLVDRPGYKRLLTHVTIAASAGRARLLNADGTEFSFVYEPNDELVGAYQRGRDALERSKSQSDAAELAIACEALDFATKADPDYRPTPQSPTAGELHVEATRLARAEKEALAVLEALKARKDWRGIRAALKDAKLNKQRSALGTLADASLEAAAQTLKEALEARAKGNFDAALEVAARIEQGDPLNPELGPLRTKVVEMRARRESAGKLADAANSPAGLTTAREALEAYLKEAPGDAAALAKAADVAARLRDDVGGPVELAIQSEEWTKALDLVAKIEKAHPGHAKLASWRAEIERGQRATLVRARIAAFDKALATDLQSVLPMLDLTVPEMTGDKVALAALPDAGTRYLSSRHTIAKVDVRAGSAETWTARVESIWELELEIDGEKVTTRKQHVLELRYVESTWRFTHFGVTDVPEGDK